MQPERTKYITNRDLLAEIHRSKISYCYFEAPQHAQYAEIVSDPAALTPELFADLRVRRAAVLSKAAPVAPEAVDPESLVVRVMTAEHVPLDPTGKRRSKVPQEDGRMATCFKPFKHYVLRDGAAVEVGRSHWRGDLQTGQFCNDHGRITDRLASMFMLLVERYSRAGNWRGYCVDAETEALTQRGWLRHDQITTDDTILSFDGTRLAWSPIKSIFRDRYAGKMFHLTGRGIDALVTPGHKFVTQAGLKPAELLLAKDRVILTGEPAVAPVEAIYTDAFVELVGWVATKGCIYREIGRTYPRIGIYQDEGAKAERIRACLAALGCAFSETRNHRGAQCCIRFDIGKQIANQLVGVIEETEKVITMPFILALTQPQRELLIETMTAGDGFAGMHTGYLQKSRHHTDAFVALCVLTGRRLTIRKRNIVSSRKSTHIHECHIFASKAKHAMVENINFHGARRRGSGLTKLAHQNAPTVDHDGLVWCPQTVFGCFMARRNGKIYLTGNTYVSEMRSHTLCQLCQMGLKFDESQSDNPFGFYGKVMLNCFRRVLYVERRNQSIRDDLLIMAGVQPSFTRQVQNEMEQRAEAVAGPSSGASERAKESTAPAKKKRGRKPKAPAKSADPAAPPVNKAVDIGAA